MNKKFHITFEARLAKKYGEIIPNNSLIAIDIVANSDLTFLSHESVRKWRLGKSIPQASYMKAIACWLDDSIIINSCGFTFQSLEVDSKK